MQQRVAIARAVAYQPQVLLMDEPFAAVDAQTRADLEDLIRRIWQRARASPSCSSPTTSTSRSTWASGCSCSPPRRPWCRRTSPIDLPDERDQLDTRVQPRFTELRPHVYEQIQLAKKGHRPEAALQK